MTRSTLTTALVSLLLVGWVQAAPFGIPRIGDRTAVPALVSPAGDPDCDAAVPVTVALGDSLILAGDTTGGPTAVDAYGCVGWEETGPETVYAVTADEDLLLHVRLTSAVDLDLFLLSACSADSCVAYNSGEFMVPLAARPEPWYLVVDGYRGAAGAYTLELAAYAPASPPAAVCDTTTVQTCGEQPVSFIGNLLDRPNLVVWAPCATYLAWGGEQWFAVSLPDSAELTVDLTGQPFDGSLWLFDDCGAGAACVAHADAWLAGEPESLVWRNLTGHRQTVYVAVDAWQPILGSEGDTELDGTFRVEISCTGGSVAAARTGWGALKARFR